MIIFDLDGCLADCEHRRHFVDREYIEGCNHWHQIPGHPVDVCKDCRIRYGKWKPDWKSFYDACDKDKPIEPVLFIFNSLCESYFKSEISIWSGRCESTKNKTINWLNDLIDVDNIGDIKMRPIGDNTPDDQLKERWLDEVLAQGKKIDFVFDDRPKVVRMWRRRGIFVFDVNQNGKEF